MAGPERRATYWRLDVVRIDLPPLRDRPEDVPLLVERLLARTTERLGRPPRALAPAAIRALLEHDWPGNVRELEHALERAVALAGGAAIEIDDLPDGVRRGATVGDVAPLDPACPSPAGEPPALAFRDAKQQVVERFERAFITAALARHRGNVSRAAEETGMYRAHLQQKLAEYGIDADAFRRGTSR